MIATKTGFALEELRFDTDSGTYHVAFDPDSTSASMAIVGALLEVSEKSIAELEPIQRTVDTDAIDTLVENGGETTGAVSISFEFAGCAVSVYDDGAISIAQPTAAARTAQ